MCGVGCVVGWLVVVAAVAAAVGGVRSLMLVRLV